MDDGGSPNIEPSGKKHVFRKLFGKLPFGNSEDVTEEEIISMVNEGHEQGVLQESEAEMIHNIFEFDDKEAKDIMTHRKNIVALDGDSTFGEVVPFLVEQKNSRYPVYQDNIDNIIGVLHIKEALAVTLKPELRDVCIKDIPDLIRSVEFIPETRNINTLFKDMQSAKTHMVIVVDEYGQTAGLVAMEDILEEIVGNIFDEHDEVDVLIEKQPDGSCLLNGMAPLDEVAEALSIEIDTEDYDTLNGLLISLIDKIPQDNEVFDLDYEGWRFHVLKVEDRMIQSVRAERLADSKEDVRQKTGDTSACQQEEKMIE